MPLEIRSWQRSAVCAIGKVPRILKRLEPLAILLAGLGLVLAWYEFNASRDVREATLFAMASELLQKARDIDEMNNHEHPTAMIGQVRVLEEAIASGVSLEGINAREVRLDHGRFSGADFRFANFWGSSLLATDLSDAALEGALLSSALFSCADNRENSLECTDLTNTNLRNAQLTGARLHLLSLDGTDFEGVNMDNAELHSVDFSNVKGLDESQLKNVCGSDITLPSSFDIQIEECK